jgi:hypothetical protein
MDRFLLATCVMGWFHAEYPEDFSQAARIVTAAVDFLDTTVPTFMPSRFARIEIRIQLSHLSMHNLPVLRYQLVAAELKLFAQILPAQSVPETVLDALGSGVTCRSTHTCSSTKHHHLQRPISDRSLPAKKQFAAHRQQGERGGRSNFTK